MATMTIDELARAAGMTVRNVREHQTRGLLPPPRLEGRTGAYDERHLDRLRLISQLQAQGLNLQAIAWLVERAPDDATRELARFEQALFAPWQVEEPEVLEPEGLSERFGDHPELLERAVAAGLLRRRDDNRLEAPSPSLLRAGEELVALGVPLEAVLDVAEQLRGHADGIAASFTELFVREVGAPQSPEEVAEADWPRLHEALERLQPIAVEALLAVFRQAMTEAIRERLPGSQAPRERRSAS
jgi:DNA-binding transcriptional MerR regulator